jgi:hypothetical protein
MNSGAKKKTIKRLGFRLVFPFYIYKKEVFLNKQEELKDIEWHRVWDCSKSYNRLHQRREYVSAKGQYSKLIKINSYCEFCKKFLPKDVGWKIG